MIDEAVSADEAVPADQTAAEPAEAAEEEQAEEAPPPQKRLWQRQSDATPTADDEAAPEESAAVAEADEEPTADAGALAATLAEPEEETPLATPEPRRSRFWRRRDDVASRDEPDSASAEDADETKAEPEAEAAPLLFGADTESAPAEAPAVDAAAEESSEQAAEEEPPSPRSRFWRRRKDQHDQAAEGLDETDDAIAPIVGAEEVETEAAPEEAAIVDAVPDAEEDQAAAGVDAAEAEVGEEEDRAPRARFWRRKKQTEATAAALPDEEDAELSADVPADAEPELAGLTAAALDDAPLHPDAAPEPLDLPPAPGFFSADLELEADEDADAPIANGDAPEALGEVKVSRAEPEPRVDEDAVLEEPAEAAAIEEPEPMPEPESPPEEPELVDEPVATVGEAFAEPPVDDIAAEPPAREQVTRASPSPSPERPSWPTARPHLMRRLPQPREWNIWELERAIGEHAGQHPQREREWRLTLFDLRRHADRRGAIPVELDPVVRDTFAELIEPAAGS